MGSDVPGPDRDPVPGSRPDDPPIPPRDDTQPIPVPIADEPAAEQVVGATAPSRAVVIAGLVVVLALLALSVLNIVVARAAEARAELAAEEALGTGVDVQLRGFPVGLRLLVGGRIDARALARDVPLEGTPAALDSLEIILNDARLDRSGDGAIEAREAAFTAELDDDGVQQLIGLPGRIPLADVELGNGVARFSLAGFALLDATAEVEAGQIVFRLTAPIANLANVRLQLEQLPMGFEARSVDIRPGVLRITGTASDLRLEG